MAKTYKQISRKRKKKQEEQEEEIKATRFYICSYYSQQKIREHLNQHADSIEPPSQISNIRGGKGERSKSWVKQLHVPPLPISQSQRNGMNEESKHTEIKRA
jgi:hypothetical protein